MMNGIEKIKDKMEGINKMSSVKRSKFKRKKTMTHTKIKFLARPKQWI